MCAKSAGADTSLDGSAYDNLRKRIPKSPPQGFYLIYVLQKETMVYGCFYLSVLF